ncbi:phosphotransferase [Arthrobacter sp. MDT3-44]
MQDVEVSTATLERVAAAAMQADQPVQVLDHEFHPFELSPANMTTGGLWRLRGTAADSRGFHAFRAVLKVICTPLRGSGIDAVPPEMRGDLVAQMPWRTEADVYESTLKNFLPPGLRIPDLYFVQHLDEDSAGIWMEDVQDDPAPVWDAGRYAHMAYLLGRLAGVPGAPMGVRRDLADFVAGPGEHVFIPLLRAGMLHSLPVYDGVIDEHLERDLLAVVEQIPLLLAELATLPVARAHGDACPQNLLQTGSGVVALDWGSFGTMAAGYDLGQLLAGRVNDGLMDGATLPLLAPACVEAYGQGLRAEGAPLSLALVRRGFAISMAIQSGLSALFPPQLDEPVTDELRDLVHARAGMARFLIDELTASAL